MHFATLRTLCDVVEGIKSHSNAFVLKSRYFQCPVGSGNVPLHVTVVMRKIATRLTSCYQNSTRSTLSSFLPTQSPPFRSTQTTVRTHCHLVLVDVVVPIPPQPCSRESLRPHPALRAEFCQQPPDRAYLHLHASQHQQQSMHEGAIMKKICHLPPFNPSINGTIRMIL